MKEKDGAHKEVMRTLGLVCGVFAQRIKGRHGAVSAYVREVESVVRRESDADVAAAWIGRLFLASIELRSATELTTETKITEVMRMFETSMPRVETIYVRLGFVKDADIRAAMKSTRRAKRLVAYALFSALGEKHAVLHIVRFSEDSIGLVVYAECIDGAWEIYYTPVQKGTGASKELILDTVSLRSAKPHHAPQMYRIESIRERHTKRTRVALAVLSTDAPINVPDPTAIASPSTSPVLFTEYANTQLKVYREIANRWARRPYPRFGRTLLSLLRTWRVVADDVMVDTMLLDVLYKIDDHDDRVALTFDELKTMVESATEEYVNYQKPWDNDDNKKKRLKAIQATEQPDERFSDEVQIKGDKMTKLNTILDNNIDAPNAANIETIMSRPAAEIASFLSISVAVAKIGTSDLKDEDITNITNKLQSENIDLTKVTGITKQKGKAELQASSALAGTTAAGTKEDQAAKKAEEAESAAGNERLKLGKYWAMVYKILHAQTTNIGTCLEKYREWYEKAFANDTDVHVVWDIGKYNERQHLGTILVGSYIVGSYTYDAIRHREKVWYVYKKKSEDSFEKGMFKKGDDRVTWTEYGAALGKTSVRAADIVSAKSTKMHGPYYTEKQVIRAILHPPEDTLRATVDKNKFWIKCEQPRIDSEWKIYTQRDVLKYYITPRTTFDALNLGANILSGVAALAAASTYATNSTSALTSALIGIAGAVPSLIKPSAKAVFSIWGTLGKANFLNWPASKERQEMLRENESNTIGDEAASAAIPRVDDTFNLTEFGLDATPAMCALALQNAERAAFAVTDPR